MRVSRRSVFACLAVAVACLAAAPSSNAVDISGSMGLGNPGGVTFSGGADILSATQFNEASDFTSNSATGSFLAVPVPDGTLYTPINPLDVTAPTGWTLTNGTYGTFTIASLLADHQVTAGPSKFRNLVFLGTYSGLPGYDDTAGRLNLTYTQIGGSVTVAGVLDFSGAVPEPATVVMAGLGGLSLVGLRRFRRKRA